MSDDCHSLSFFFPLPPPSTSLEGDVKEREKEGGVQSVQGVEQPLRSSASHVSDTIYHLSTLDHVTSVTLFVNYGP